MKIWLVLSLLILGQILSAQTAQRTNIPGTKCSLAPPDGFVPATTFGGFQHVESGASIMVNEIPAPYQTMVDGFTADALKKRGMTLISREAIDFNNAKATIIHVSQPANGTTYLKQMLIFGDAEKTVLVNGIYPEASKDLEVNIRNALFSIVYDDTQVENPLDAATFIIDVSGTDFKLIRYMSGSLLYSTDGKMPTEKPTLIVGSSIAKVSPENQQKYAEERLKKLPRGELNVVKEIKAISIDNLNGYEIVAEGKTKNDTPELVYQTMLFNDKGDYYIVVGKAGEEFEQNLEAFRKVTKTFKRK
ncbi:MAG: hypothetical protein IT262_12520 [Saprospiraceae bacterium]|nr:hypothetical protein [Saprospiraceae bacterium]